MDESPDYSDDEEVFYDAGEECSPDDGDAPSPESRELDEGGRRPCDALRSLPRRFPRTFALIFKVFLPLYLIIAISMLFGYFLCRFEAPGEMHSNNMALAAARMMEQLKQFNLMTINISPLLCLDLYLNGLNGTSLPQDIIDKHNDQLFVLDGLTAAQDLLFGSEFSTANLTVSNVTALRWFMADCATETKLQAIEYQKNVFDGALFSDYIGSEVTFNWIKCPVPDQSDAGKNETDAGDLMNVVTETFVIYEAGAQLEYAQQRWEQDLNKTYHEYYAIYQTNFTENEARAKAIRDAYANADGFDHCVEDVLSSAWWAL